MTRLRRAAVHLRPLVLPALFGALWLTGLVWLSRDRPDTNPSRWAPIPEVHAR